MQNGVTLNGVLKQIKVYPFEYVNETAKIGLKLSQKLKNAIQPYFEKIENMNDLVPFFNALKKQGFVDSYAILDEQHKVTFTLNNVQLNKYGANIDGSENLVDNTFTLDIPCLEQRGYISKYFSRFKDRD